jgi:hypothetical protein
VRASSLGYLILSRKAIGKKFVIGYFLVSDLGFATKSVGARNSSAFFGAAARYRRAKV